MLSEGLPVTGLRVSGWRTVDLDANRWGAHTSWVSTSVV
jgi:hypothetical protein